MGGRWSGREGRRWGGRGRGRGRIGREDDVVEPHTPIEAGTLLNRTGWVVEQSRSKGVNCSERFRRFVTCEDPRG